MRKTFNVLLWVSLIFNALGMTTQPNYKIARKIPVGGEGNWDYITVDGTASRIYVSHATTAVVVDIKTGNVIGSIPDTKGIHGIALAKEINRGYRCSDRKSDYHIAHWGPL